MPRELQPFRLSSRLFFHVGKPAGRFIMEIANGESNPSGRQPVENTSAETNFGPANNPDWVNSEEYLEWLRLAKLPHTYPHE